MAVPGDDPVDDLVARGAYVEAARLAAERGEPRRAIALYERVWRFGDALALAEALGDWPLALRLALEARDARRTLDIVEALPRSDVETLRSSSALLEARGHAHEAAVLAERAGDYARAAELYRRADARLEAAAALELGGHFQEAGRLYEEIAATDGPDGPAIAEAHLRLGRLLGRLGRHREAARALQAALRHDSTATAAGRRLAVELITLGLPAAADEIARRLRARGAALPERGADLAALELGGTSGAGGASAPTEAAALPRFFDLRLIGTGALGRVYAAEDRLLGRPVALKALAVGAGASGPERQAFVRFVREAEAASRLRHPHIVRLHDLDEAAGLLVLEHLPGGTLAERLQTSGALSPAAVRRLALDLLGALGAAHAAGVVHRDIKPANVLFDAAGNAKLGDFGAAHLLDFGGTQTGGFIGTLGYLAPEQVSGSAAGPPTDVYALGVTLFEALTGRLPFQGPDMVAQHLSEAPPRPSDLRPGLSAAHDEVLLRALAKAPADRFASAEQMAEAVRAWPEDDVPARPAPAAGEPEPASPRSSEAPAASGDAEPAARRPLGATPHGDLYAMEDARLGRVVWVEERGGPLSPVTHEAVARVARAGGPHVQRVLDVDLDGGQVLYEAIDGEPTTLGALPPEEQALLADEARAALEDAGLTLGPDTRVVRTDSGPVVLVITAAAPP